MGNLSAIGRIFYGISIAAIGLLTIYYNDFPYFMIPPEHPWIAHHVILIYFSGAFLILAGACIVFEKMIMPASLLLGAILLLIFVVYFIPYQLTDLSHYTSLGSWENSAKELALAGGAFVIAACQNAPGQHPAGLPPLSRLIPMGKIIFALTIIVFAINHFVYAHEASDYMPAWIPQHLWWMYFTGTCLLGAGIGILFDIRPRLLATLLGLMIFLWVLLLHIPKSVAAPFAENGGEISSGFLALAYCGTAFAIAGKSKK
jgi:uncharacterized membrane protein